MPDPSYVEQLKDIGPVGWLILTIVVLAVGPNRGWYYTPGRHQVNELQIDVHQATRQHQGYLYMERMEYRKKMAAQAEAQADAEARIDAHRHAHGPEGLGGDG
jgi:hypothetical protein